MRLPRRRSCCGAETRMSESPKSDTLPELYRLDGRVAIVTGGAGMLGLRYAEAIAEAGGIPVLADLRQDAIDVALERIKTNTGVKGLGVRADIAEKADIDALVQQ